MEKVSNFIKEFFVGSANAQAASGGAPAFDIMSFLPLILIFGAFYFFMIRPQSKKAQEQREMVASLQKGDRVLTNGGFIGTVTKLVSDNEIMIDLGSGNEVLMVRSAVSERIDGKAPKATKSKSGSSNVKSISDAKGTTAKRTRKPTTRRKTTTTKTKSE